MEQKTEPLVSVKMITYNHASYIAKAIEGVLMQETSFPIELVIGEDCSTDGTREIVFDYQKRYPQIIRVVTSEANVGMKANSRRVDAALRGKYIAWCEGDDYWHHPRKLQMQVDYLEAHPECVLVYSDYDMLDTRNGRWRRNVCRGHSAPAQDEIPVGILLDNCPVRTPTVCARRDDVMAVRTENPYEFSEHFLMGDAQTWIELSLRGRFHFIASSLATVHRLAESATQSRCPQKKLRFALSSVELREHYATKLGVWDRVLQRTVHHWASVLYQAYIVGDRHTVNKMANKIRDSGCTLDSLGHLCVIGSKSSTNRLLVTPLVFGCIQAIRARSLMLRIRAWLKDARCDH